MSRSSPRPGRPGSAGCRNGSGSRREPISDHSCMLRIGERLMRAGSEGNLVQKPAGNPVQKPARSHHGPAAASPAPRAANGFPPDLDLQNRPGESRRQNSSTDEGIISESTSSASAPEDLRSDPQLKKQISNLGLQGNSDSSVGGGPAPCSSGVGGGPAPCSSGVGGGPAPCSSGAGRDDEENLEKLILQQCDVVRKKQAVLEHLREQSPHHSSSGSQLMKNQVKCLQSCENQPCPGLLGSEEDLDLETMCDGDLQLQPFMRGCRARASLPGAQSHCQTQRMLGVLYLQYGEETMQVQMPPEISSLDSVRALFVLAFPHQLTMKMLQSPNMAICIRDTGRHLYYDLDDLDDLRNVASHSFLKAYHRDPVQMFHTRPAGTERRISKEVLYGSLGLVQNCSLGLVQNCSALHALQGSMSPPTVRSMPSSPSRIAAHGGDRRRAPGPGSATLPRQRLSEGGRSMSSSSCSILERRDVRPDGGRPESYSSSGHLGRSSSRASPPPSVAPELVPGILGGLQQYKASVRPLVGYVVPQNRTLLRQKSMRPGDAQLPVETRAPPLSPHRAADVRMIDGRGPGGGASPEKMSSLPVSLRRDSNGVKMPNRRSCSSSSNSSVFVDSPLGLWVQTHEQGSNDHSERMKAMEQQIASLTGLVHQVLSLGSDAPGLQDRLSEQNLLNGQAGGSARTQSPPAWIDSTGPAPPALQAPPTGSGVQQGLELVRRRLDELRLELSRLRCLQLSHLESVGSMLRMAGQELVVLLWDWLVQSQQTEERWRVEVEDDIAHYLTQEERILSQLRELEDFVDRRRGPAQVTLAEVEEAAVGLQRVGERLVVLRGAVMGARVSGG